MPYLEMKGITKLYPNDVLANDRVDFAVERGEIHAIVGENGAGKTTLMRILFGLEQPDSGAISLDGRPAAVRTPLDAVRLGIGMVHQHFTLIPEFTVTENVVIGAEPRKAGIIIDAEAAVERIAAEIKAHGFGIEPRARVSRLTVGQMQQVEILKMLYRRADLLVLDEPTAVLAEQEIRGLFDTMRSLRGAGKTCVFVTHKLREVKEIADRVTVMRKGSVVAVRRAAEVDKAELSRLMVGKSVLFQVRRERGGQGEPVLELRGATVRQRGRRRPLLDGVDLTVRAREIVGVTGVSGNGLDELEDVVSGLRRVSSGTILHNGENVSAMGPARLRARGIAYVPSDRLRRGASLLSSVAENLIVSNHHAFLRAGFLNRAVRRGAREGLFHRRPSRFAPGDPFGWEHPEGHPRARTLLRLHPHRLLRARMGPGRRGEPVRLRENTGGAERGGGGSPHILQPR
jgi:simple sugar transport system ATP-binding protein